MGAFSQGPMDPGFAVAKGLPQNPQKFGLDPKPPAKYVISGVTLTANGATLGGCTVEIYETITSANPNEPKGRFVNSTISDANGNYSVDVYSAPNATFRVVAYLAGSPDVAGVTVNTLVGTQTQ